MPLSCAWRSLVTAHASKTRLRLQCATQSWRHSHPPRRFSFLTSSTYLQQNRCFQPFQAIRRATNASAACQSKTYPPLSTWACYGQRCSLTLVRDERPLLPNRYQEFAGTRRFDFDSAGAVGYSQWRLIHSRVSLAVRAAARLKALSRVEPSMRLSCLLSLAVLLRLRWPRSHSRS